MFEKTKHLITEIEVHNGRFSEHLKNEALQIAHIDAAYKELTGVEKRVGQLKSLIEYGELQWDGQLLNKGMLEGLKEALRIMEGEA